MCTGLEKALPFTSTVNTISSYVCNKGNEANVCTIAKTVRTCKLYTYLHCRGYLDKTEKDNINFMLLYVRVQKWFPENWPIPAIADYVTRGSWSEPHNTDAR